MANMTEEMIFYFYLLFIHLNVNSLMWIAYWLVQDSSWSGRSYEIRMENAIGDS